MRLTIYQILMAYYFSTNNGLLKISERINNIISVYEKDDEILGVEENDFYRVLINSGSIDFYEDGFFSFSYKSISSIFSTPSFPMITGTPTYIPFKPYSPSTKAAQGKSFFLSFK